VLCIFIPNQCQNGINEFGFNLGWLTFEKKTMFEFRNLEVYKKSKQFHLLCNELLQGAKLDRYIKDQLGRASFSVPLNIAEGSGKFTKPDRRNFFIISRASLFECVAIVDILKDKGEISDHQSDSIMKGADELSRILYAMIKNLS
jgi:four helix bundle protein